VVEFSRDICIGIEGGSMEVELSQEIPIEELLEILIGEANFK
jgi:hypothetical protein